VRRKEIQMVLVAAVVLVPQSKVRKISIQRIKEGTDLERWLRREGFLDRFSTRNMAVVSDSSLNTKLRNK
jgi:hypothetical protein